VRDLVHRRDVPQVTELLVGSLLGGRDGERPGRGRRAVLAGRLAGLDRTGRNVLRRVDNDRVLRAGARSRFGV